MNKKTIETENAYATYSRLLAWDKAVHALFPDSVPQDYSWTDIDDIIRVLTLFTTGDAMAYGFLPGSGWQFYREFKRAPEPGYLDMYCGTHHTFPIGKLTFHSILDDSQWYYFELEPNPDVKPIFDKSIPFYEAITVLDNGEYAPYKVWETEEPYKGYEPTEHMTVNYRYYEGTIVFFSCRSAYEQGIDNTAAQTILGSEGFRYFIRMCAKGIWRVSYKDEYYFRIKKQYESTLVK